MERRIVGYHVDDQGDWVAHLDCGHRQHVRHRPPFSPRPWVTSAEGRASRLGAPLECPLCDRYELPERLEYLRTSEWDERSMPQGLRRAHRLGEGIWGLLRVQSGTLSFRMAGRQPELADLGPGAAQAIPPGFEHDVTPAEAIRFSVDFLKVERPEGDAACWAPMLCPECGALGDDGHRPGCSRSTRS
jgi:tellurite methyltransferase